MVERPKRPTMHDVAQSAGVSLATVSRAINGDPSVSPDTQARVLTAAESLGYRRNDMARDLRAGRTSSSIGLVIEDVSNPFYSAVARAVEDVARLHDAMVVIASSAEIPEQEQELVETLFRRRVDGLIIVPAGRDHRYLLPEIALGTAVVFLDRPPVRIKADAVLIDNVGGSRQATEHFVAAGHRRIAVLGDRPDIGTMVERVDGYRRTMDAAGLPVQEDLIRMDLHSPDDAAAATADLLALTDPPTAFFPLNNRMTVGVLRQVWRGSAEVDVVGFDDFELSDVVPVPFTVVAYDTAELGRLAAELLFERLAGSRRKTQRIMVPTALEQRGITARR